MVTKKGLEKELATSRELCEEIRRECRQAREHRDKAQADLKETRDHFADLKERLSNAEAETARLNGYLARVHEDDVVRDGMVEIEDEEGKRQVPKRPPPMMRAYWPGPVNTDTDMYGRLKKQTHWTNY